MKRLLLALISALALSAPAHAQQHVYTQPELDALLAPIALYPDGLIAQVLEAAKHPDQVAAAAKLPKDAQPDPSWDPNVTALLAFPEILARMGESPQWTADLGQAFANQEPHVMDTVQALRKRAQQNGQLQSNDQTTVTQDQGAIVVEPRNPEVVYVPYYDPYVVYGPWWWPAYTPVVWSPWIVRPCFVGVGFFAAFPVWHAHNVVVVNHVNVQRTVVRPNVTVQRNVVVRDFHRPTPTNWSHQQWNGHQWQPRQDTRQGQPRQDGRSYQPRADARQYPSQQRPQQQRPQSHTPMPAATRYSDSRGQQPRGGGQMPNGGQMHSGGGQMHGGSGQMHGGGWGGGQRMGGAGHGGGGHRG
jgi:hypothetical protein